MNKDLGIPTTGSDGEFTTFNEWVNKATSWIGGQNALCVDAKDRICRQGSDFMRARDEGMFPVRFYYGAGGQTEIERRRNEKLAKKLRGRRF